MHTEADVQSGGGGISDEERMRKYIRVLFMYAMKVIITVWKFTICGLPYQMKWRNKHVFLKTITLFE